MGTFNFNNKENNIYKDTYSGLEFIFINEEENKFRALLNKYKSVEEIPEHELLTGIYFKEGTRETMPNHENGHVRAKYVRK